MALPDIASVRDMELSFTIVKGVVTVRTEILPTVPDGKGVITVALGNGNGAEDETPVDKPLPVGPMDDVALLSGNGLELPEIASVALLLRPGEELVIGYGPDVDSGEVPVGPAEMVPLEDVYGADPDALGRVLRVGAVELGNENGADEDSGRTVEKPELAVLFDEETRDEGSGNALENPEIGALPVGPAVVRDELDTG